MDVTILECVHNLVHRTMDCSRGDLYSEEMLCSLIAYTPSPIGQSVAHKERYSKGEKFHVHSYTYHRLLD